MSSYYTPFCTEANCTASRGVLGDRYSQCQAIGKLRSTLCDIFGHTEFRPGQLDAAISVLHGHDTFVRMSTGAGKGLCMFLPPLAVSSSGMGVVISPLNCLMDEQVK